MATNNACACFRWTFPSALSYLFFFLSGEHFYVSEFFYWHCNCPIFSISLRGFYFPQKNYANKPVTELVKYKSTLMFKTYFIDLVEIKKIGFQPKSSTR